jgi:hypothetical protein
MPSVRELQPGGELAGYRIEAVEREERGAAVLRARDLTEDRAVVLYVANEPPGEVTTARFVERTRRLSAIEHPHLLSVQGARTLAGRCVAVAEAPTGKRLDTLKPGRTPAIKIIGQVAAAADALEDYGADPPPLTAERIWVDDHGDACLDGLYAPDGVLPRAASAAAELAHLLQTLTPRGPQAVISRALEGAYLSAGQFAHDLRAAEHDRGFRRLRRVLKR